MEGSSSEPCHGAKRDILLGNPPWPTVPSWSLPSPVYHELPKSRRQSSSCVCPQHRRRVWHTRCSSIQYIEICPSTWYVWHRSSCWGWNREPHR